MLKYLVKEHMVISVVNDVISDVFLVFQSKRIPGYLMFIQKLFVRTVGMIITTYLAPPNILPGIFIRFKSRLFLTYTRIYGRSKYEFSQLRIVNIPPREDRDAFPNS